mgnify:CR=1 FL=1
MSEFEIKSFLISEGCNPSLVKFILNNKEIKSLVVDQEEKRRVTHPAMFINGTPDPKIVLKGAILGASGPLGAKSARFVHASTEAARRAAEITAQWAVRGE